jgi:hypothetical protein
MLCDEELVEAVWLRMSESDWQEMVAAPIKRRAPDAGPLPKTGSTLFDEFERETWAELEAEEAEEAIRYG